MLTATAAKNIIRSFNSMSDETSNSGLQNRSQRAPRRRRWLFVVLISAAAASGFAAGRVHSAPWWHWGGRHHFFDAEEIGFIVQHRVGRVLSKADATPEQRDKIGAITKAAVNDVMAMRKDPSERRERLLAIMKADTVDRSALESLRKEQFDIADAATKRVLQAVADAAEVLKPEQRRQLAERWERWHRNP
jgi:periplasmic protein CpxP/Spy